MRQLKISKQITNRESQSLDKYLQEIGKVDLLTPDEEVILAQKIREGDQLSLERLTKANLRFVVSVAKQYQNQGLSLGDLISERNLGLIKAAQRFDETRGFKFISYAVWWIRQSILQALAEQSRIVRLPLNKIGSINKINKMYALLEQSNERPPSAEEIAKVTAQIGQTLIMAYTSLPIGSLELTTRPINRSCLVSSKPRAFKLAQIQAVTMGMITNARHQMIKLGDFEKVLLPMLDGKTDVSEIINNFKDMVNTNKISMKENGVQLDASRVGIIITQQVENTLRAFTKSGMLVA